MREDAAAAPASRAKPYINVTPFIDILLVLLIIFMVITPVRPSRFKALVPQPTPPVDNLVPSPWMLVVAVDQERRLSLNTQPGFGSIDEPASLIAELARVFRERRENGARRMLSPGAAVASADDLVERTVFIKAPRALRYGEVARLIDAVRDAGASPVGLQIDDLN